MQLSDRRVATKQLLSCNSVFAQMSVLIIRELQKPFSDRFSATSNSWFPHRTSRTSQTGRTIPYLPLFVAASDLSASSDPSDLSDKALPKGLFAVLLG